ncbi:MAG: hypothetical protein M0009_01440 [Deltaproteobacteria bacterium]|nr:hypothetical protein [Deltaproteobacteria bacterium]
MEPSALFREIPCRYFTQPGPANSSAVLAAVNRRAKELGLQKVVLATNTGGTAYEALRLFDPGLKIIAVTHETGFREANGQELPEAERRALQGKGVAVVTAAHAFGGVGRAIRNAFGTYQANELIAATFRLFGQGMKVAVEVTLMAADAGQVRTDEDIIAVGGSGRGADTALVLRPATSSHLFDLQVKEVICKPVNLK